MQINKKMILALVAGLGLYHLCGSYIENHRSLVDAMVLAELLSRAVKLEKFFCLKGKYV